MNTYPDFPSVSDETEGWLASRKRVLGIAAVLVALICFGAIIWYAYMQGMQSEPKAVAPIITARIDSAKVKPDDPGGREIPYRDALIYDEIDKVNMEPMVEQLLPSAERPVAKPTFTEVYMPPPLSVDTGTMVSLETAKEHKPAPGIAIDKRPTEPVKPIIESLLKPAPVVETGPMAFRVQLGSLRDQTKVVDEWKRLKGKYSVHLGNLTLYVESKDLGARGIFHRIQAGPLTKAKADAICASLKADKAGCWVVRR